GVSQGHAAASNGRRSRAAIGLNDVTVDRNAMLTQLAQIDRRAQRAPDQALDLHGTPALLTPSRLTVGARTGGSGQHAILCRNPALIGATQETWHRSIHRRGTDDLGVAKLHQNRTLRMLGVMT